MPRLTRGQIAPGIEFRRDRSLNSAHARIAVLKGLLNAEDPVPDSVRSMTSFRQLALWVDDERGITPLSIKTLRKHLDALYDGGSARFREDMVQLLARQRPQIDKASVGETKKHRGDRLSANAAMEMTARYLDLLERLKKLSLVSETAESELMRHLRRFREGGTPLCVVKNDQ